MKRTDPLHRATHDLLIAHGYTVTMHLADLDDPLGDIEPAYDEYVTDDYRIIVTVDGVISITKRNNALEVSSQISLFE